MTPALSTLTGALTWLRGPGLEIVLLVLGTILLTRLATWLRDRITARIDAHVQASDSLVRTEASKHRHAVAQVVTWAGLVLMYCATAILVVQRLGLPITGFVAPATVVGVALGFGAQRVVQDLLAGFFMVAERQYGFGDLIRINVLGVPEPVTGTVEEVTLRITRIRSVNGELVTTANGQILQSTNLSRDWARAVIDVPIPAGVDINLVNSLLERAGTDLYADVDMQPLLLDTPTVMGVESLAVDQFNVRIVARTLPGKQFQVGRALRARITHELLRGGISVPADLDTAPPTRDE